jgi:hypothetical protein
LLRNRPNTVALGLQPQNQPISPTLALSLALSTLAGNPSALAT